jgi:hypothetical protein
MKHLTSPHKAQPVNAVWGNSRCLLLEPYGTHKYTVQAECRKQVLHTGTIVLKRVNMIYHVSYTHARAHTHKHKTELTHSVDFYQTSNWIGISIFCLYVPDNISRNNSSYREYRGPVLTTLPWSQDASAGGVVPVENKATSTADGIISWQLLA